MNKETKLQITPPEGYEIDRDKSTFEEIVFKKKGGKLPESWEELEGITGYYTDIDSKVGYSGKALVERWNYNLFATKEQAEASIALAQITQLLKIYNGDWKPDWDEDSVKFIIQYYARVLMCDSLHTAHTLSFETREKRDHFFKHHQKLLKQAAPLLWGVTS